MFIRSMCDLKSNQLIPIELIIRPKTLLECNLVHRARIEYKLDRARIHNHYFLKFSTKMKQSSNYSSVFEPILLLNDSLRTFSA